MLRVVFTSQLNPGRWGNTTVQKEEMLRIRFCLTFHVVRLNFEDPMYLLDFLASMIPENALVLSCTHSPFILPLVMERQRIGEKIKNHSCPLVVSVMNPESLKGYFHYIENRISTLSVEVKISWAKTVLRNNNQGPFFF